MSDRILINKVNLPLYDNESIREYTDLLSDKCKEYLSKNIDNKSYIYIKEIFKDKIISELETRNNINDNYSAKIYMLSYTRKSKENFEFFEPIEVLKIVDYIPKLDIHKSNKEAKKEKTQKSLFANLL